METRDGQHVRFLNPINIFSHVWQFRDLIRQLTWRAVIGRYKGSFVGLGWSFIHPLIMLAIYTFVFSAIFKSRWGVQPDEGRVAFALALFMGLITFNIFSESVNSAPSAILNNVNFVKKVVFPLEILPVVGFLGALVNALFSLAVLLLGLLVFNHFLHWTVLLLPLVWLPVMCLSLGCSFFLASIGVFIRDVGATISILTTMLFFLSPIFYPIQAVPERFRFICMLNPMALFVEDARKVVLWGMTPDWPVFAAGFAFSLATLILGFIWFMKTRKGFADVV
jgi:lipopolysaccharide transport system permease protein